MLQKSTKLIYYTARTQITSCNQEESYNHIVRGRCKICAEVKIKQIYNSALCLAPYLVIGPIISRMILKEIGFMAQMRGLVLLQYKVGPLRPTVGPGLEPHGSWAQMTGCPASKSIFKTVLSIMHLGSYFIFCRLFLSLFSEKKIHPRSTGIHEII